MCKLKLIVISHLGRAIERLSGASFSGASSDEDEKKSPALAFLQSKVLIQGVLGLPELDFNLALEIVIYQ